MIIYKTTNTVTGKSYVGMTTKDDPLYLGSGKYIKRSIRKYGKGVFVKETLEECSSFEQLCEREIFWISEMCTKHPHGYNLTDGGEGILNPTEEVRNKIRQANTGTVIPDEVRTKISESLLEYYRSNTQVNSGKTLEEIYGEDADRVRRDMSERAIAAMSQDAVRIKLRNGQRERVNNPDYVNPMVGKNHYDIWLEKYGKEEADRRYANMVRNKSGKNNPNYGKPRTEETRRKISEGNKGKTIPTAQRELRRITIMKKDPKDRLDHFIKFYEGRWGKPLSEEKKESILRKYIEEYEALVGEYNG